MLTLVQSHSSEEDGSEELALVVQLDVARITGVAFAPEDIAIILMVAYVQGLHRKRSNKK